MIITEVAPCKKNRERVNVYLDGEFAFACYMETAVRHRIKKGAALTAEQAAAIRAEDERSYAWQAALKMVSRKLRTEKEIRGKLREKGVSEEAADGTVARLAEYGYVDDEGYARLYAQELFLKYGPRVVREKMAQRGIDRETAERAIREYENKDALQAQLDRLLPRYAGLDERERNQKVIRSLLAKGFCYDDVKNAVKGNDEE